MNNSQAFRFRVDATQVAARLRTTRELIEDRIVAGVEMISIATHAFIIKKTNEKFAQSDFKRNFFLGLGEYGKDVSARSSKNPAVDDSPRHLRWIKISDGMWVVELDERARWIEEGRPETFMGEWLLKPGAKGVNRAKDGSLYRVIPFKQTIGKADAPGAKPGLAELVRKQAKKQKISLTRLEKNPDKTYKEGILHKLDMRSNLTQEQAPDLFSKPRTQEMADLTGLRPHGGIYKLQGAVVAQRDVNKGKKAKNGKPLKPKFKKETVVFRVISSKHEMEGRWMYPTVQPFNVFAEAYEWANKQWEETVKSLEQELARGE